MWNLLPVTCYLALIQTVTSRTEPLDFVHPEHHNEMAIPSGSMGEPKDIMGLKLFPQRLQEIDSGDTSDILNWNKLARYDPQILSGEENVPFGRIDGAVFDQLDDTVPEDFEEVKLNRLSSYLTSLLRQPFWNSPLIVMEDPGAPNDFQDDHQDLRPMLKRSRYNRYTWKRQNGRSRNTYEYDPTHICTPSREDVYQLLVALHDVRQGNKSRTVHYCNRRRPVNTVITNLRFLGRRK